MTDGPLVSIVCLCYNQSSFVREAIESVKSQTYGNIQLILVDDASTDGSQTVINELADKYSFETLLLNRNVGNTSAFNKGLALCRGDYVIDFAADDILLPDRVEKGVEAFQTSGMEVGVHFCNAAIVNEHGVLLHHFYPISQNGHAINPPPQGDLYAKLVSLYFINPVSMMSRREVFDDLGGYDEELTYEDFDFWVRSSRKFKYLYTDEVLVQRRRWEGSMSKGAYGHKSKQMESTFIICQKIKKLNQNTAEDRALRQRIYFEMKQCLRFGNFTLFWKYLKFLTTI